MSKRDFRAFQFGILILLVGYGISCFGGDDREAQAGTNSSGVVYCKMPISCSRPLSSGFAIAKTQMSHSTYLYVECVPAKLTQRGIGELHTLTVPKNKIPKRIVFESSNGSSGIVCDW
ncbi:hypothetical protein ACFL2D_00790 [Patescibacteria group bacterium]